MVEIRSVELEISSVESEIEKLNGIYAPSSNKNRPIQLPLVRVFSGFVCSLHDGNQQTNTKQPTEFPGIYYKT